MSNNSNKEARIAALKRKDQKIAEKVSYYQPATSSQ